jgi:hypothetical protein
MNLRSGCVHRRSSHAHACPPTMIHGPHGEPAAHLTRGRSSGRGHHLCKQVLATNQRTTDDHLAGIIDEAKAAASET